MKLTVEDTANLLGTSPQFIRLAIQKNALDIGECAKLGREKWRRAYVISPYKVANILGVSIDKLERMTHDHRRMRGEFHEED